MGPRRYYLLDMQARSGLLLATATLAAGGASAAARSAKNTVPLLNVTSAGFAKSPAPTCASGKVAPQPLLWNVMYEPVDGVAHGNDLSKLNGAAAGIHLCIYPSYWPNASERGWTTSVSAVWPSLAGPWCDQKAHPGCTKEYIKNQGGCPQAVDMATHKSALKTGLDAQVPPEFGGYISYDMEGWDGVLDSNSSGYAKECGGAAAFEAAAKVYFTETVKFVKAQRPKAKVGFYGRPAQDVGGRSYDFPDQRYADSLRAHNDRLMWFFDLVDFIQPSVCE